MAEADPFVTSALTVLTGVLVFVLGQIVLEFYIKPIKRQDELIVEITDALIYYADIWANPGFASDEIIIDASGNLRKLSSQLRAVSNSIRGYSWFASRNIVISYNNLNKITENLIGLSNSLGKNGTLERNEKLVQEIREALNMG